MSAKKSWLAVVVGAGLVLNGCAATRSWTGWTERQTAAATAAAVCGIIGGNVSGWVNHNNGHPLIARTS